MKITLRINNDILVPEVPALDDEKKHFLKAKTKYDTLSYAEMDSNFINIMEYLIDVFNKLKDLNSRTSSDNVKQSELNEVKTIIEESKQTLETFKEEYRNYKDSNSNKFQEIDNNLNRKIENIKTINNNNIIGLGNINLNITRDQFLGHQTNIGFLEVGSYAILKLKDNISVGGSYPGSLLYFDDDSTTQGTWRNMGKISNNIGLFIRIV